jgi:hypothetical protein
LGPAVVGFVRAEARGIPPFALRASGGASPGKSAGPDGRSSRRLPLIGPGQPRWRWDIRDVKDQAGAGGDGEGPRPGLRGLIVGWPRLGSGLLASLLQIVWVLGGFLIWARAIPKSGNLLVSRYPGKSGLVEGGAAGGSDRAYDFGAETLR